jgi:type VI protein secretion system component VasK
VKKQNESKALSVVDVFAGVLALGLLATAIIVFLVNLFVSVALGQELNKDLIWLAVPGVIGVFLFISTVIKVDKHNQKKGAQQALDEAREMQRIKKSMTPAEWELYIIQKENQRLLRDLQQKPAGGNPAAPRPVFGMVKDMTEDN